MLLLGFVLYNNSGQIGVIVDVDADSDAAFYLYMLCFLVEVLVLIAMNSKVCAVMFIPFVFIFMMNAANVICDHYIVFHVVGLNLSYVVLCDYVENSLLLCCYCYCLHCFAVILYLYFVRNYRHYFIDNQTIECVRCLNHF